MAPQPPRRYSQEEASEILRRALERQHGPGDLAHDELVETAREIGVAPEEIERAVAELHESRAAADERAKWNARRRAGFFRHFASFLIVIAGLLGLNLLTGGPLWVLIVAVSWGIPLGFHGLASLPDDEQKFQRHVARQQKRFARAVEKRRKHESREALRNGGRAIGNAVQKGVGEILHAVAEQIESNLSRSAKPARHANPFKPPESLRVRVESESREVERREAQPEDRHEVENAEPGRERAARK